MNSVLEVMAPITIRTDGVIVQGPNRGARTWDVHEAAKSRK